MMQDLEINVTLSHEEVLKSKFINTLARMNGCLTEAEGDIGRTDYSANGVARRIRTIKLEFERELRDLSSCVKMRI